MYISDAQYNLFVFPEILLIWFVWKSAAIGV